MLKKIMLLGVFIGLVSPAFAADLAQPVSKKVAKKHHGKKESQHKEEHPAAPKEGSEDMPNSATNEKAEEEHTPAQHEHE